MRGVVSEGEYLLCPGAYIFCRPYGVCSGYCLVDVWDLYICTNKFEQ